MHKLYNTFICGVQHSDLIFMYFAKVTITISLAITTHSHTSVSVYVCSD